jgi:hypothetical protein
MLTQVQLKNLLFYNPQTGVFTWRINGRGQALREGARAGYVNNNGYRMIKINGKHYPTSHLAYLYMTGDWPTDQMDHKNRKRADDCWRNLRSATPSQNTCNRQGRPDIANKFKGITRVKSCWTKSFATKSYRAQIAFNRKTICIGYFATEEEAHAAYKAKALELHGEFANLDTSKTS